MRKLIHKLLGIHNYGDGIYKARDNHKRLSDHVHKQLELVHSNNSLVEDQVYNLRIELVDLMERVEKLEGKSKKKIGK